ncbi:MAG: 30S ribosomal protein S20 [Parcubacteria group bacterium]|nr:30S ribosomal protein S20 [Parcubacteria group bacterium]
MAITSSAKKALRAAARKREVNDRRRKAVRDIVRRMRKLTEANDRAGAERLIPEAYKAIDKALKRGIFKKNTAARKKSNLVRLTRRVA